MLDRQPFHGEGFPHQDLYCKLPAVEVLDTLHALMGDSWNDILRTGSARPADDAAGLLLPQAMHLICAVMHCIDSGYLLAASALIRPTFERLGVVAFLERNPGRRSDWLENWPNRSQPEFGYLISSLLLAVPICKLKLERPNLNAIVHGNADSIVFGDDDMEPHHVITSPGSMFNRPDLACEVAISASHCANFAHALLSKFYCPDICGKAVRDRLAHGVRMLRELEQDISDSTIDGESE